MKIKNSCESHVDHWLKKPLLSGKIKPWLQDHQSLTLRLQQHYKKFQVLPLSVAYGKAYADESKMLNISPRTFVLKRDVFLQGDEKNVVFAHSVLPKKILRGQWMGLKSLGAKPLGAMLFANPQVKRTALRYKKLSRQHVLNKSLQKYMADAPKLLWARRSVFSYRGAEMIVTEVFLPHIIQY
jgi:chorismate--pyruvate lyase